MLFNIINNKLKAISEQEFKLEKDIQRLIEPNVQELFGLYFISSEFPIENFRMDTVCFNKETNAFVIIEYKRGKNESLVDQGYAYLATLLKRKADFVLLYNSIFREAKGVGDFDWSQTRIIFVSPKFTDYQKSATTFSNMPFELYEVSKYDNNLLFVEDITKTPINAIGIENIVKNNSVIKAVNKEIKVYTEEGHLSYVEDEKIVEIYYELKEKILALDPLIELVNNKYYIAYKISNKNFCSFFSKKGWMTIILNIGLDELIDIKKLCYEVPEKWLCAVKVLKDTNPSDLIEYIRQSYSKVK